MMPLNIDIKAVCEDFARQQGTKTKLRGDEMIFLRCPYCGTAYTLPVAVLDLYYSPRGSQYISEKRRIVVWSGQSLYKWHVDRSVTPNERISPEDCKRVGYFQYHKNQWFLVNQTSTDMWNVSTNQQIQPGQAVALTNGLKILLSKKPTGRLVNVMITK